jgi:hypothetical protein
MKQPAKPMPEFFISKDGMSTFWFWVGVVAILGGAIYAQRVAVRGGLRPQFIIMNEGNTAIQLLPEQQGLSPDQHRELTLSQTRLLMDSIFNKSAIGLDAGDRAQRLMTAEPWEWVKENLVDGQQEGFVKGRLHQKLTIESIDVTLDEETKETSVHVKGQLIRIGVVGRQFLNQLWNVDGQIVWERNTSLRDCGRYPLLCTSFGCIERLKATTLRDLTRQEEDSLQRAGAREKEKAKAGESEASEDKKKS